MSHIEMIFFHGSELDPDLKPKLCTLDFGFSGHQVIKIKFFIMFNTKANKISLNPDFGKFLIFFEYF